MKEIFWWIITCCIVILIGVSYNNMNDISDSDNYEVLEFTHKNHDYMFVKIGTGYTRIGGIVHDPDCKFCNK